jgi:ubiquitin C-terminal hydrolase
MTAKPLKKKELAEKVRSLMPYLTDVNAFKAKALEDILNKDCVNMRASLVNKNNSCYIDSIIVAIFQGDAKHIFLDADINSHGIKSASNIKVELNNISNSLGKTPNMFCTNLRALLQTYQDEYHRKVSKVERIDWIKSQSEPLDFMRLLYIIFKIPDSLKLERESWGTNVSNKHVPLPKMTKVGVKTIKTNFTTLVDLIGHKEINISDYYPKHLQHTEFDKENEWRPSPSKGAFLRRSERITYLSTPFLHIHLNRLYYDGKMDTVVIPRLKMKLKENKKNIYLRSMILHHGGASGGHYTCLYECNGQWYHYDDTRTNISLVGDFDTLITQNKYLRNSTDMFYW